MTGTLCEGALGREGCGVGFGWAVVLVDGGAIGRCCCGGGWLGGGIMPGGGAGCGWDG